MACTAALAFALILSSCSDSKSDDNSDSTADNIAALDTAKPLAADSASKDSTEKKLPPLNFNDPAFSHGVIPAIKEASAEYAQKLSEQGHEGFLIVDKQRMKVILYDKYGNELKSYGMACARNYGTKHKKADSRTPEGFFTISGIYDSTDWLFTNDNGYTSPAKGQFGPRFMRLKTPVSSQIGIHGTAAPWSIGHRVSHGCIRITNDNIMELHRLCKPGMPVIVIPGKRDREVNHNEGYDVVYFPTAPESVIDAEAEAAEAERKAAAEKAREEKEKKDKEAKEKAEEHARQLEKIKADSIASVRDQISKESENQKKSIPDSIF